MCSYLHSAQYFVSSVKITSYKTSAWLRFCMLTIRETTLVSKLKVARSLNLHQYNTETFTAPKQKRGVCRTERGLPFAIDSHRRSDHATSGTLAAIGSLRYCSTYCSPPMISTRIRRKTSGNTRWPYNLTQFHRMNITKLLCQQPVCLQICANLQNIPE